MTYLEIIEWLNNNVRKLSHDGWNFTLYYEDIEGYYSGRVGKDLISIVLKINGKELIK